MNYISLNGKKSLLIKGLLISELPPITKPLVRTKTEEIDGRDGDIVTKLGYAAYDKKMTIGLFGDYNIDDIIEYFDSEGIVVFSNEPDKYYRYQILQQIDFDRLIRFRTATVVFHVQPFKFSSVDDTLVYNRSLVFLQNQDLDVTADGMELRVSASTLSGLKELRLWGTPTTTEVEFYVPIQPVTLKAGQQYIVNNHVATYPTGVNAEMRIIRNTPTAENTAGGEALTLEETHSVTWTQAEDKIYNYLYVKASGSNPINTFFIPDIIRLTYGTMFDFDFVNRGNVYSRPKITIYSSVLQPITINDDITVTMDTNIITLDAESMNAYAGDVLKNRSVSGDLKNLRFNPGRNTLTFDTAGIIDKVVVENYSRWI